MDLDRDEALALAKARSEKESCIQHVNAKIVELRTDGLARVRLYVSDWYDEDSTIASFSNGHRI